MRGPHAEDAEIREAAFVIAARPKHGPAIWRRLGRTFTHAEALLKARQEAPGRIAAAKNAKPQVEPEPDPVPNPKGPHKRQS